MSESADIFPIAGEGLSATVSPLGAELRTLRDPDGRDLLWDGDPAWWTGRAPILFPVVGRVADDRLRIGGESWPMEKHGFARRRRFAPLAVGADAVTLRLTDDAETRAHYPFAFALDLAFAIAGARLTMTATVENRDAADLPFRFGFHPAFRWPLPYGAPRDAHRFRFEAEEPGPLKQVSPDGLVNGVAVPSPVAGRELALADGLFGHDALIFAPVASRGCVYGAPGTPGLRLGWGDMPDLGIWTKPGAPYVCVEPWQGHADPAGEAGDFRDGRNVVLLPPGERCSFSMTVEWVAESLA